MARLLTGRAFFLPDQKWRQVIEGTGNFRLSVALETATITL
jgi:hypothetical protein